MVITPTLRPERLDKIVKECLQEAGGALAEKESTVKRQIDSKVPEHPIDRALLKEAVSILMAEAIRALEKGKPLRVTVKANDNALMVALKAPGAGLADHKREGLFGGDPHPGTLARAHAVVAAHGGVVWANGIEGRGITWYLTLPTRRS